MNISLIVAVAENDVIGQTGEMLPWHQSADLVRFRRLTTDHTIIMGRKTYESIGRPLPKRRNIIITHNPAYEAPGCEIVGSLKDAITLAQSDANAEQIFIIGGGMIFEEALPLANTLYLTRVHGKPTGDVFFRYTSDEWQETSHEDHAADDKNQYAYSFVTLQRK